MCCNMRNVGCLGFGNVSNVVQVERKHSLAIVQSDKKEKKRNKKIKKVLEFGHRVDSTSEISKQYDNQSINHVTCACHLSWTVT